MKLLFPLVASNARVRPGAAAVLSLVSVLLVGCGGDGAAGNGAAGEAAQSPLAAQETPQAPEAPPQLRIGSTAEQALACQQRMDQALLSAAEAVRADTVNTQRFLAGESPVRAVERGWPVDVPEFMHESILPCHRIVAYYGNPLVRPDGRARRVPKDEMLSRLRRQVRSGRPRTRDAR
jgi:hypothetical protein